MTRRFVPVAALALLHGWFAPSPVSATPPAADGLYVTFQTTLGDICCELLFDQTPRTVANLVGLVSGTRDWVDFEQGRIRGTNFYQDVVVHRVSPGSFIQAGSRSGLGDDGPGYTFTDEILPELTHGPGVLSMANAGPDTNGSQWFVTLRSHPEFDGANTVFGSVVDGLPVAEAISNLATNSLGRPIIDIVLTNAFVTRNGVAALTFDETAAALALPLVKPHRCVLQHSEVGGSPQSRLALDPQPNHSYWVFATDTLANPASWSSSGTAHSADLDLTPVVLANPFLCFSTIAVETFE